MAPHSSTLAWKNPKDGEAWKDAVHRVAEGRTRLSDFTFTFHFHALEKEMASHSSVLAWRIPGMGEPCGLLSMGSHRVGHDWCDLAVAAATYMEGFTGGSAGKESTCSVGDLGSIPGLGRCPGEENGYPLQYSSLKNSMDCIESMCHKSGTWLNDFHPVWKHQKFTFAVMLRKYLSYLALFHSLGSWDLTWWPKVIKILKSYATQKN